jgi:hypothetical protein
VISIHDSYMGLKLQLLEIHDEIKYYNRGIENFLHMGTLKSSTSHDLFAKDSKASSGKRKRNKEPKSNEKCKDYPSNRTLESIPSSKEDSSRKKFKCVYCKRLGHDEHRFYNKMIDELTHLLQNNNIQ